MLHGASGITAVYIAKSKSFCIFIGGIQVLCQQRGGWGQKMAILLIYSTINADVGGWVGLKKPKSC